MKSSHMTWLIAVAKLRVRRKRLIATVVVSGLAFVTIFVGSMGAWSLLHSFDRVSDTAYQGSSYLQAILPAHYSLLPRDDSTAIALAKKLYQTDVDNYTAAYKKLGIEPEAVPFINPVTKQDGVEELDMTSPYAIRVQRDHLETIDNKLPRIDGVHEYDNLPIVSPQDGALSLKNSQDKEIFIQSMTIMPDEALKPYVLASANDDSIPIVLGSDVYGAMSGISDPRSLIGQSLSTCWLNTRARDLMENFRTSRTSTLVADGVTYTASNSSANICLPLTIRDDRSQNEKQHAAKKQSIDTSVGIHSQPDAKEIKFKVVGITPTQQPLEKIGLANIISFFGPAPIVRSIIPQSSMDAIQKTGIFNTSEYGYNLAFGSLSTAKLIKADSGEIASRLVREYSCYQDPCPTTRPFVIEEIATGYSATATMATNFMKISWIVGAIMLLIAIVTTTMTYSRIVDDGRREIATYRAIGIRDTSIYRIFLLYSVLVSFFTALTSLIVSLLWLLWADMTEKPSIVQALSGRFGYAIDASTISFISIPVWAILTFILLVGGCGIISILISFRSLRRQSIVEDLRLVD